MNASSRPTPPLPDVTRAILDRLGKALRPVLTSHIRIDGDALGAELALLHVLRARGQEPHIVNDSKIPQIYQFLPGIEEVATRPEEASDAYDLAVVLDVPTWNRARNVRQRLRPDLPVLSIDHHPPLERMGDLEWVDTGRSSVGEMVYELVASAGWTIPPEAATCLYVAILTDTGRFTFPNTTARALRAASELVELGAQHVLAAEKIYQENSFALLALRAESLGTLRLHAGGKVALMRVTHEMMTRHGIDPIDTQEMADYPRSVTGVLVGVLLRDMKEAGKVKVSLRSRNGVDIEPVARAFGGGGHHEAAGAEIPGDMDSVERRVLEKLLPSLKEQGVLV